MNNRIRELRKEKGITMKQLGKVVCLAESTISQYETGKRQPDNEALLKMSEYFGVTVGYLLGVEDIKKEAAAPECDSQEKELMQLYSALPESDRKQALDYFRFLADRADKE